MGQLVGIAQRSETVKYDDSKERYSRRKLIPVNPKTLGDHLLLKRIVAAPKLPPTAGCGPDERIVRLPRNHLINAKRDIPDQIYFCDFVDGDRGHGCDWPPQVIPHLMRQFPVVSVCLFRQGSGVRRA